MDKDDICLMLIMLSIMAVAIVSAVYAGNREGHKEERKLLTPYFKQELNNAYWDGYEDGKKLCQ